MYYLQNSTLIDYYEIKRNKILNLLINNVL